MRVIKRSGSYEDVSFDKILNRIRSLSFSEEFSNGLNIDCAVFNPFDSIEMANDIAAPNPSQFTTALGLGIRGGMDIG